MSELVLQSAEIGVRIAVDHGAEIREVAATSSPNMLFFEDWPTPLRASKSSSYGTSQLDWLSEWRGGWQELFPNAGYACEVLGVPLPFHGDVSRSGWTVISASEDQAVLQAATRLPLLLERTMRVAQDRPVILIDEVVSNVGVADVPYLWGHHPAFDARGGVTIDLPAAEIVADAGIVGTDADVAAGARGTWPFMTGSGGSTIDVSRVGPGVRKRLLYAPGLPESWAAVRRDDGWGIAMAWDRQTFPDAWIWVETGTSSFPWYGRACVVAIEATTSSPEMGLAEAHRRWAAHVLAPAQSHTTWLTMSVFQHDAGQRVTHVDREGIVSLAS